VEQLMEQGAVAIIFDVRYNGGGYAEEMVKLLDYLLPKGDLFRTVDFMGVEDVDKSDAACVELPMAVLVNGSSYSAAEFFAAALREYEWATVVGEKTSGKGHFQVTYPLSDGSAVGLSIGKYFTPKGQCLEGVGLTPDVPVAVDEETAYAIYAGTLDPMEDPQILAAVEALK
jgi:carboxyl-terminal processing protease